VIEKVLKYIRKQQLLLPGDRLAVAVSGGADSVALLRVLLELRQGLGIVLSVAHFHHQIRGAEADADAHDKADRDEVDAQTKERKKRIDDFQRIARETIAAHAPPPPSAPPPADTPPP